MRLMSRKSLLNQATGSPESLDDVQFITPDHEGTKLQRRLLIEIVVGRLGWLL